MRGMVRFGMYVIAFLAVMSIGASTPLSIVSVQAQTNPSQSLRDAYAAAEIPVSNGINLPVVAGNILKIFLGLVGLGSMVAFIYGGAVWMQARGNQEDVQKGKDVLKYAVVGIAVAAGAYTVVNFVTTQFEERLRASAQGRLIPCYCPPPEDRCYENLTPAECAAKGCGIAVSC